MKKKEWSRPEVTKVKLLPEEAVLTACKIAPAGGNKPCGGKGFPSVTHGS